MKYYDELLSAKLFTKEKLNQLTGSVDAAKALLKSYLRSGYIEKIRYNYYGIKSLETKQIIPNRFEIGSNINKNTYISHHSAFEYYGMANQIFSEVYVSSKRGFENFEFDGVQYTHVASNIDNGITRPTEHLKVTDLERTIIDNIKDFAKIGGLEELLRCLLMVTFISEEKLLSYLTAYNNQFLYQKTGYILSHYQKSMKLSDDFFDVCKSKIKKSVRYLYDGIGFQNPKFYSKWQLFAPENLMKLIDEGGDEIV